MVTPLLARLVNGVETPFIPEQDGYSALRPVEVIATDLAGGSPRLRRDKLHGSATVDAVWMLDRVDYTLFHKFIRETLENGSLPCLVDLVTDFFQLARHRATFVPGTIRASRVSGLTYYVSAQLRTEQLDAKTASMEFSAAGQVELVGPGLGGLWQALDTLQLIGAELNNGVNPAIKLDGNFTVNTVVNSNTLTLVSPHLINPDWSLLSSYPGSVSGFIPNCTITKRPT